MDPNIFNEAVDGFNDNGLNNAVTKLITDHQDPDTVAAIVGSVVPRGQFARYRGGILSFIDEATGEPVSRYKISAVVTPIQ